jgi:hypothetical protein
LLEKLIPTLTPVALAAPGLVPPGRSAAAGAVAPPDDLTGAAAGPEMPLMSKTVPDRSPSGRPGERAVGDAGRPVRDRDPCNEGATRLVARIRAVP